MLLVNVTTKYVLGNYLQNTFSQSLKWNFFHFDEISIADYTGSAASGEIVAKMTALLF